MNTYKEELIKIAPPTNRWKASQSKSKWSDVREHNAQMNTNYLLLIKRIKRLYSSQRELAFEQDSRAASSVNSTIVHAFLTKSIYLELECDYVTHQCSLLYDFQNCPYESTIISWLKAYPFSMASKHEPCNGGVTAYFNRVYQFQRGKHFSYIS